MSFIVENIRKYADKRNISISELEKKANLGNGTIGRWKNSSPSVSKLKQVADALGVSLNTLLKERE